MLVFLFNVSAIFCNNLSINIGLASLLWSWPITVYNSLAFVIKSVNWPSTFSSE